MGRSNKGVEDKVKDALERVTLREREELTPLALLEGDLGMDSLDVAELAIDLEDGLLEGAAEIDTRIADGWRTVQDVVDSMTELREKALGVRVAQ